MEQSNLARIFKALSSEQRLKLFKMIYKHHSQNGHSHAHEPGSSCCGGMDRAFTKACSCLNISRSTVSHHFKELVNSGLIKMHRTGQSFYCEVNEEAVNSIKDFLE